MLAHSLVLDALGTRWWIEAGEPLPEAELRSLITGFEARYSRFKPDSQLSALNRDKRFPRPSAEFLALVRYGLEMYRETGGTFNMSVGARLEQDGYGQPGDPSARVSADLAADVSASQAEILLAPHVRLDFGGFGKGWLVDEVGRVLAGHGLGEWLVNGGGDILVGPAPQELLVEHPLEPGRAIGSLTVADGAFASSSDRKRRWHGDDGRIRTHIIDPLFPADAAAAEKPLSAHVRAATARTADTLGTVFLLAGESERRRLAARFRADYLLVTPDLRYRHTPGFGFHPNALGGHAD